MQEKHNAEIKQLKADITKLNSQIKTLTNNTEREHEKLVSENKILKSEQTKMLEDIEKIKDYREKCIKLEKALIEAEHKVVLKDVLLSQKESEKDNMKCALFKLERKHDASQDNLLSRHKLGN